MSDPFISFVAQLCEEIWHVNEQKLSYLERILVTVTSVVCYLPSSLNVLLQNKIKIKVQSTFQSLAVSFTYIFFISRAHDTYVIFAYMCCHCLAGLHVYQMLYSSCGITSSWQQISPPTQPGLFQLRLPQTHSFVLALALNSYEAYKMRNCQNSFFTFWCDMIAGAVLFIYLIPHWSGGKSLTHGLSLNEHRAKTKSFFHDIRSLFINIIEICIFLFYFLVNLKFWWVFFWGGAFCS